MKRECRIDDILEEYDFNSNKHDYISDGIQRRMDEMRYMTLKEDYQANPDLGYKLILRNMCSFPEFYKNGNDTEIRDRFSCIDTKPVIVKYNHERKKAGLNPIPSKLHEEVDDIVDFVSEALVYSRFYKSVGYELNSSARAFFPDNKYVPTFTIGDYLDEVNAEIESLSDKLVLGCMFPDCDLDQEIISDVVRESVITYFARLEYNAAANKELVEKTPYMTHKLYSKDLSEVTDIERIVSQIFVARDWMQSGKNEWIESRKEPVLIGGKEISIKDYLKGGEQSLLFEIVPSYVEKSDDLKDFFGGKTLRMVPEEAEIHEGNAVQAADLGDEMEQFLRENPKEFIDYAAKLRLELINYRRRRPTMVVPSELI